MKRIRFMCRLLRHPQQGTSVDCNCTICPCGIKYRFDC